MGILNVTTDSFSDGNKYFQPESAIKRAFEIQNQGADIIDIGAQSTRPGYSVVSWEEEIKRLSPILYALKGNLNIPISIDTFYWQVAEFALNNGATIINDVSGACDDMLLKIVQQYNADYILMYDKSGGTDEAKAFFLSKIEKLSKLRIALDNITIDPGIGFSKTYSQDLDLLNNISDYRINNLPVLIGLSRKRVVVKSSGITLTDKEIDNATLAANIIAIQNKAEILRVHNVTKTVLGLNIYNSISRGETNGQDYN